jgi:hypothetical protein
MRNLPSRCARGTLLPREREVDEANEVVDEAPAPFYLLENHPDVFRDEILAYLSPTDCAMLARVNKRCAAAVMLSGVCRAGSRRELPFRLRDFVVSAERLVWGEANNAPCGWDEATLLFVASFGSVETVCWLQERVECPMGEVLCAAAAAHGNFEVLRWALEQSYPCGDYTFGSAASGGHLAIMQFLRERGCPWTQVTCADAAGGGHLEALQWLIEGGCPWDSRVGECAALGGHTHVLSWAFARSRAHSLNYVRQWQPLTSFAARGGHLETLQWLLERGYFLRPGDATDAARNETSNIAMMTCMWEHLQDDPQRPYYFFDVCLLAAESGSLPVLQWARQRELPWDTRTLVAAAIGRHEEVFVWARDNGCSHEQVDTYLWMRRLVRVKKVQLHPVKRWMLHRGVECRLICPKEIKCLAVYYSAFLCTGMIAATLGSRKGLIFRKSGPWDRNVISWDRYNSEWRHRAF